MNVHKIAVHRTYYARLWWLFSLMYSWQWPGYVINTEESTWTPCWGPHDTPWARPWPRGLAIARVQAMVHGLQRAASYTVRAASYTVRAASWFSLFLADSISRRRFAIKRYIGAISHLDDARIPWRAITSNRTISTIIDLLLSNIRVR